jgi:endogenous inhibitor of DNA gyrase (YacG/DUF329 family)
MGKETGEVRFSPTCPTCRGRVIWEGNPFRPFCSERCRAIDFGHWATERYVIPGDPMAGEDSDDEETFQ